MMNVTPSPACAHDSTIHHVIVSVLVTIVTVVLFGFAYPLLMWVLGTLAFHAQAGGSLLASDEKVIGSSLVGQAFSKPQYFHGRPSAAGKGYDPTSTGGTNYGPTSKKLLDSTRAAIAALRKENPNATIPVPMDLVTSSASGIDPDISPAGAQYQVPRVARARRLSVDAVQRIVAEHTVPRQFGILGEPHVNVLLLNRALDATLAGTTR